MGFLGHLPSPPCFAIDWPAIEDLITELPALARCQQDPVYHQEGDVLTHTKMVADALVADTDFRQLDDKARQVLFFAAILHDIAKPETHTLAESGRISHPHHGPRGARRSQEILWKLGFPFQLRQQVVALVRHHLLPYNWHRKDDIDARVLSISQEIPCRWLGIIARADIRGRICADQPSLLENIDLFDEFCKEKGCWEEAYEFPSEYSRYFYLQRSGRSPDYRAHDESQFEVVILSGLPGAGKDSYYQKELAGLPMISLDRIREEFRIGPGNETGKIVAEARERAKRLLRERQPFVWNATNLTRRIRIPLRDLFSRYGARIRLVYIEAPWQEILKRNAERSMSIPLPALEKMIRIWEMPRLDEAHRVEYFVPADSKLDRRNTE